MVRSLPYGSDNRIDGSRILGFAAAIALHALALMLLLIPMTAPQVRQATRPKNPEIRWIEREKEQPKKPVTVPVTTREKVEVPKKTDTPRPIEPIADPPAIIDGDARVVDTQVRDAGIGAAQGPAEIGPIAVASLGYGEVSPPPYPRAELRSGIQGTVVLKVLVDTDGTPLEVVVQTSSGNRNLDKSAVQHVLKRWHFQPAMKDGHAVQAYGLVPIVFSLQ